MKPENHQNNEHNNNFEISAFPETEKAHPAKPETATNKEIVENGAEHPDKKSARFAKLRLRKAYETGEQEPVALSPEDSRNINTVAEDTAERLQHNYLPGFGIFPSAKPDDNFYNQVWSRDLAHAGGNFFGTGNPHAFAESLNTIFKHQREDGMLPLRVEREFTLVKVTPVLKKFSKPLFNLIEKKWQHRDERPVYEGQDFSGAEDTVPAILIAAGELYTSSKEGREFGAEHYEQMLKAVEFFRTKTDPEDGLVVVSKLNPDWADSLIRAGKLGGINVWWARALRMMEFMAKDLGHTEDAEKLAVEYKKIQASILSELYNSEEGYFKAAANDDRVDTVASIFGALYLLSPEEAVKVEQTLKLRVKHASGLKNFDPPYLAKQIFLPLRLVGHGGYHNNYVWPWVGLQNIQVKIKIALEHPDASVRSQYKNEAVQDLADNAKMFLAVGGSYEIFKPDEQVPARSLMYEPPHNFMGTMSAYQGAYGQLKKLGWIENENAATESAPKAG